MPGQPRASTGGGGGSPDPRLLQLLEQLVATQVQTAEAQAQAGAALQELAGTQQSLVATGEALVRSQEAQTMQVVGAYQSEMYRREQQRREAETAAGLQPAQREVIGLFASLRNSLGAARQRDSSERSPFSPVLDGGVLRFTDTLPAQVAYVRILDNRDYEVDIVPVDDAYVGVRAPAAAWVEFFDDTSPAPRPVLFPAAVRLT